MPPSSLFDAPADRGPVVAAGLPAKRSAWKLSNCSAATLGLVRIGLRCFFVPNAQFWGLVRFSRKAVTEVDLQVSAGNKEALLVEDV